MKRKPAQIVLNIRDIPEELRRELKAEAAASGMRLGDYTIKILRERKK
jgi:plasmid stability protein